MNYQPASGHDSGAHFGLGIDQMFSAGEINEMADPWVGQTPNYDVAPPAVTDLPPQDLAPWAATMQLPGATG